MDENIHYSVDAHWVVGGDMGRQARLTEEQKVEIMKAVWAAVFKVRHPDEESNGSAMGDITLKETIADEDGMLHTVHTVLKCEKGTVHTF